MTLFIFLGNSNFSLIEKKKINLQYTYKLFMLFSFRSMFINSLLTLAIASISCVNDTRCVNCRLEYLSTSVGLLAYYLCNRCVSNRTVNQQTGQCQCIKGYYETGYASCQKCSQKCSACSSSQVCSSCYAQDYRNLNSGQCVCIDGYEQKSNSVACKQKPNILMIILSTLGSGICMVLCFILCAFIRMRRCSQQIHAQPRRKKFKNSAQIQEFQQQYGENIQKNQSNIYWNTKSISFKQSQICSICLDTNPLFFTQCGHYFHQKCIYQWLTTNRSCPTCNIQIQPKQIKRWCQNCRKVLMPVIMNIAIKRDSKKKKKVIHSTPIKTQICDQCQKLFENHQKIVQQKLPNLCLQNQNKRQSFNSSDQKQGQQQSRK